jgi:hypothetical protein
MSGETVAILGGAVVVVVGGGLRVVVVGRVVVVVGRVVVVVGGVVVVRGIDVVVELPGSLNSQLAVHEAGTSRAAKATPTRVERESVPLGSGLARLLNQRPAKFRSGTTKLPSSLCVRQPRSGPP